MRKKRKWLVAAALVLGVGLFAAFHKAEPRHEGRPLSAWVEDLRSTNAAARNKAVEAIRAIGPDAVAHLTNDLAAAPAFEEFRQKAREHLSPKVRGTISRLARLRPAHEVRLNAALALRELGPAASNAAPALVESLPLTHIEGIVALDRIGEAAVPALREALKSESDDRRTYALRALGDIGPAAAPAVPDIIEILNGPSAIFAGHASFALAHIGAPAVPALTNNLLFCTNALGRAGAAMALHQMGAAALPSTNALAQGTRDAVADVRLQSLYALFNVHRNEAFGAPIFAERLRDEDPTIRKLAVHFLGFWENSFRRYAKEIEPLKDDVDDDVRKTARELIATHFAP